jgi:hypothetical protein
MQWFALVVFILVLLFVFTTKFRKSKENMQNAADSAAADLVVAKKYLPTLEKYKSETHFPYRFLHDENNRLLPFAVIMGFFRDDKERVEMYNEFVKNKIKIVGATFYKSFPKPITDGTGDNNTINDPFDYFANIHTWMCCFDNPAHYGFDERHKIIEMSESDFYDADNTPTPEKKYDMIYVCLKDTDSCPADGWNAVNRNYKLALECFPILINEFNMKILVVGRVNCGLEVLYGDKIEIVDFLPYHEFQQKIRESKCLFVPNVYDASPRVISESISKNVPVLMNRNILCGSKYITHETGELFNDSHDIRYAVKTLLAKYGSISPRNWWNENYSKKKSAKKLKEFLHNQYPEYLENVGGVYFF